MGRGEESFFSFPAAAGKEAESEPLRLAGDLAWEPQGEGRPGRGPAPGSERWVIRAAEPGV